MIGIIPSRVFFTSGAGSAKTKIEAFELALREAGIEKFNLVPVSSIIPPGCKIISRGEGLSLLKPGQVVFIVLSRVDSKQAGQKITASIGAAMPKNGYGYLSEYYGVGDTDSSSKKAEEIAKRMLATATAQKAVVVKVTSISSSIRVKNGLWSCAVSAAVFV